MRGDHHECGGIHMDMTIFIYDWLSGLENASNSPEYSKVFQSCLGPIKKAYDTRTEVNGADLVPVLYELSALLKDKLEKRRILDRVILSCTKYH
jgi:hypothetical protein